MKAKTYYLHPEERNRLHALPAVKGESVPFKVIKESDMEKMVEKAANAHDEVMSKYLGTAHKKPSPIALETTRAMFKSIGLL